jgi:hypothetical protein
MWAGQEDQIGRYLGELMALVARATPGAFSVERTTDRRYALTTENGRLVAVVNRRSDADLFARDRLDLRALVSGVAEVLSRHHPDGRGKCAQDGELMPCTTRRDLGLQLGQRAASA